jgi:hypothetical protein
MKKSIGSYPKRKRGRPATGKDPLLNFRSPPELTAKIDDLRASQPDIQPSRSEAIRQLVERGLSVAELRLVQHPGGNLSLEERSKRERGWRQTERHGVLRQLNELVFYKSVVDYFVELSTNGESVNILDLRQAALSDQS